MPLRVALGILGAIACYFAVVIAIAIALPSERVPLPPGSRGAELPLPPAPRFVFDAAARIDFERRMTAQHTVPIVATLAVVAVALIVRSLISRYRSWRARRPAEPKLPPWMIR